MPARFFGLALIVVACGAALHGCAVFAIPALGTAAVGAGGDLVKAGTSHTFGGATYRTFSAPLVEIYGAARQTLARLGFPPPDEEFVEEHVTLRASAIDRTVRIDLQPITPELTQLRVFVRRGTFGRDPSTASELVAQTELTMEGSPAALARQR